MGNSQAQKRPKPGDKTFVALAKQYHISNGHCMELYADPKRIAFVSIDGVYRTWTQCPPTLMYTALFILPLQEKWIQSPHKCDRRYALMLQDEAFVRLLRWKLSQKLLFCLLDNDKDDGKQLVAPIWHRISARLQELYDPMTRLRYKPMVLDVDSIAAQLSQHDHVARQDPTGLLGLNPTGNRFALSANDVIFAFQGLSFKFSAIAHILATSNPTLRVMTTFQCAGASIAPSAAAAGHGSDPPAISTSPAVALSLRQPKTIINPCADTANQGFVWIGAEYYFDS